jgi:hypothetical protein
MQPFHNHGTPLRSYSGFLDDIRVKIKNDSRIAKAIFGDADKMNRRPVRRQEPSLEIRIHLRVPQIQMPLRGK